MGCIAATAWAHPRTDRFPCPSVRAHLRISVSRKELPRNPLDECKCTQFQRFFITKCICASAYLYKWFWFFLHRGRSVCRALHGQSNRNVNPECTRCVCVCVFYSRKHSQPGHEVHDTQNKYFPCHSMRASRHLMHFNVCLSCCLLRSGNLVFNGSAALVTAAEVRPSPPKQRDANELLFFVFFRRKKKSKANIDFLPLGFEQRDTTRGMCHIFDLHTLFSQLMKWVR